MTQVQQNNIQDLDDLAAQVEELVGELSEACEKVSKRLSDDEPEDETAAPEDRASVSPDDVEATAADASGAEAAAEREPHPAEQAIDELEQQLEDLIELGADATGEADTADAPAAAAKKAAVAPAGTEDLEDLDQQIAALTDELLEGDFVDAGGETVGTTSAEEADAPQAADASTRSEPVAEPDEAPEDSRDEVDEAREAARAEPVAAASAAQGAAPAPKQAAPRAVSRAAPAESPENAHRVVVVLLAVAKRTEAGARTLANLASLPLKNKPKIVRDTVGWFGLWTLFLAICVWLTLAFFRSPDHPEADGERVRIRTADESSSPPANQRQLPHPENVRSGVPAR